MTALEDRFWAKVAVRHGCWLWTAATNGRYGVIGRGGRAGGMSYAHRVSWELAHGAIPAGLDVCHTCDNPLCVRPTHLFLGTRSENMQDCKAKGRWNAGSRGSAGERNGRTKLTDLHVAQLRQLANEGWTQRRLAEVFGIGQTQVGRLVRHKQRSVA